MTFSNIESWSEFSSRNNLAAEHFDMAEITREIAGVREYRGFDPAPISNGNWALRHFLASTPREMPDFQKNIALLEKFVSLKTEMRDWILIRMRGEFEIDKLYAVSGANLLIGEADDDRSGVLTDPHLLYFLEDAVCFTEAGRSGPQKKYHYVRRCLAALLGGDQEDSIESRSPMSRVNRAILGYSETYTLSTLEARFKLQPIWAAAKVEAPATIPEIGRIGSQAQFDEARMVAATKIRDFWPDRRASFEEAIYSHLNFIFGENDSSVDAELRKRAHSTANYFWRTFDPSKLSSGNPKWNIGRDRAETRGLTLRQARGVAGFNTSRIRREGTLEIVVGAIQALIYRDKGEMPRASDVAKYLEKTDTPRSIRTIQTYWREAMKRVEGGCAERSCLKEEYVIKERKMGDGGDPVSEPDPEDDENLAKIKKVQIKEWILAQRGSIFRDTADPAIWRAALAGYWSNLAPSYLDPETGLETATGMNWYVRFGGEYWLRGLVSEVVPEFRSGDIYIPARCSGVCADRIFESDLHIAARKNAIRAELRGEAARIAEHQFRRKARARFSKKIETPERRRARVGLENLRRSMEVERLQALMKKIQSTSRRSAAGVWFDEAPIRAARKRRERMEEMREERFEIFRAKNANRHAIRKFWGAEGDIEEFKKRRLMFSDSIINEGYWGY